MIHIRAALITLALSLGLAGATPEAAAEFSLSPLGGDFQGKGRKTLATDASLVMLHLKAFGESYDIRFQKSDTMSLSLDTKITVLGVTGSRNIVPSLKKIKKYVAVDDNIEAVLTVSENILEGLILLDGDDIHFERAENGTVMVGKNEHDGKCGTVVGHNHAQHEKENRRLAGIDGRNSGFGSESGSRSRVTRPLTSPSAPITPKTSPFQDYEIQWAGRARCFQSIRNSKFIKQYSRGTLTQCKTYCDKNDACAAFIKRESGCLLLGQYSVCDPNQIAGSWALYKKKSFVKVVEKWDNCFSGDAKLHTVEIGIAVQNLLHERLGRNIEYTLAYVEGLVDQANLAFKRQIGIELSVRHLHIQEVSHGVDWETCPRTIWWYEDRVPQLGRFQSWVKTHAPPAAIWHLLGDEDCIKNSGVEGMVRQIGGFCNVENAGLTYKSFNAWNVFAHELGHTLGAFHTFQQGRGRTGGIMDYADGHLNGAFQFHSKYSKTQICRVLDKAKEDQCPYFYPKGGEKPSRHTMPPTHDRSSAPYPCYEIVMDTGYGPRTSSMESCLEFTNEQVCFSLCPRYIGKYERRWQNRARCFTSQEKSNFLDILEDDGFEDCKLACDEKEACTGFIMRKNGCLLTSEESVCKPWRKYGSWTFFERVGQLPKTPAPTTFPTKYPTTKFPTRFPTSAPLDAYTIQWEKRKRCWTSTAKSKFLKQYMGTTLDECAGNCLGNEDCVGFVKTPHGCNLMSKDSVCSPWKRKGSWTLYTRKKDPTRSPTTLYPTRVPTIGTGRPATDAPTTPISDAFTVQWEKRKRCWTSTAKSKFLKRYKGATLNECAGICLGNEDCVGFVTNPYGCNLMSKDSVCVPWLREGSWTMYTRN